MVQGWFRKNGADILGFRSAPRSLFQIRRNVSNDTSKGVLSYDDYDDDEQGGGGDTSQSTNSSSLSLEETTNTSSTNSTSVGSSLLNKKHPSAAGGGTATKRLWNRRMNHKSNTTTTTTTTTNTTKTSTTTTSNPTKNHTNHNYSDGCSPSSIKLANSAKAATGSIKNALYTLMGNEDLTDVRIHGCDGGNVVAVRALLAARSPVFRSKFYGENSATKTTMEEEEDPDLSCSETITHSNRGADGEEDTKDDQYPTNDETDSLDDVLLTDDDHNQNLVPADGGKLNVTFDEWDCRILYLIVEYCYTDHLTILTVTPSDEIARLMASLRCACKYFQMNALLDKVDEWSDVNTTRYPGLVCAMIDEGMRLDDIAPRAVRTLQVCTEDALLPSRRIRKTGAAAAGGGGDTAAIGSGISAFSKPGLMFILRFLEDTTSHTLLYDAIMRWVDTPSSSSSSSSSHTTLPTTKGGGLHSIPDRERAARFIFASRCAKRFLKVGRIDPTRMMEVVKSGLIDVEKGPTVDQYWGPSLSSSSLETVVLNGGRH